MSVDLDAGSKAGAHLSDAVIDLIAACFSPGDEHAGQTASRRGQLIANIRAHVEANLSDPGLDVASIAAAHHISTSYLQKLFASESISVAAFIRERRLERCRRDLADPANAQRSAASIAAHWGFHDASHFSRLFRNTYGMTPGDCRARPSSSTFLARASASSVPGTMLGGLARVRRGVRVSTMAVHGSPMRAAVSWTDRERLLLDVTPSHEQ